MRAITLQGTTLGAFGGLGDAADDAASEYGLDREAFCKAAAAGTLVGFLPSFPITMACAIAGNQNAVPVDQAYPCEREGGYFDENGKGYGACAAAPPPPVKGSGSGGGGKVARPATMGAPAAESGIGLKEVAIGAVVLGGIALFLRRRKRAQGLA